MSPIEGKQVLAAISDIHLTMNDGFEKIHKKINSKFDECTKRLSAIETAQAIKKALDGKNQEDAKKKRDYWIPIIRAVSIAGVLALLAIAGKLLLFGMRLL